MQYTYYRKEQGNAKLLYVKNIEKKKWKQKCAKCNVITEDDRRAERRQQYFNKKLNGKEQIGTNRIINRIRIEKKYGCMTI